MITVYLCGAVTGWLLALVVFVVVRDEVRRRDRLELPKNRRWRTP